MLNTKTGFTLGYLMLNKSVLADANYLWGLCIYYLKSFLCQMSKEKCNYFNHDVAKSPFKQSSTFSCWSNTNNAVDTQEMTPWSIIFLQ